MRYTEEQKTEILEYARANTIVLTCEKFKVSKYAINKWKGWVRKNARISNKNWYDKHAKQYYSQPRVRIKQCAATRAWREENPEKSRAISAEGKWRSAFRLLAYYANRTAQRKKIVNYHKITPFEVWKIARRQRLCCAITGLKLHRNNISLDHIISLSSGGSNAPDNLQLLHRWANIAKYDLTQEDFLDFCNLVARKNPKAPDSERLCALPFIAKNQYTGFAAREKALAAQGI